ncbi:MAG: DinB family protein [Myxococcaceae bacterium]|nr:DinB family protein [Myxococcaceae bacterium]
MIDLLGRLISWDRWANLAVFGPLQVSGGEPVKALAAFQHVLETELLWLRWMDGDPAAWIEPWKPPTLDRCRDFLNEVDGRIARLADALESRLDETFEFETSWAGRQRAEVRDALPHVLMHSSQYRGEAAGFLNAAGLTVPDIDYMRWLTAAPER